MSGVPVAVRAALLQKHGNFSQAYSAAYQQNLQHFGDGRGFLAYKKVWGTALVLADPIAPRAHYRELIELFLREQPDAAFGQISRATAQILASMGFFINEMGLETRVDLAGFSFSGKAGRTFRRAVNRANREGYVIKECLLSMLDANEVRSIAKHGRFRPFGIGRELCFLTRPFVLEDEVDTRKFFAFDRAGRLVAFACFEPVYDNGRVVGYVSSTKRALPNADSLIRYAIMHRAIQVFQEEGRKWLFLGLSPFADIEDKDFASNKNWLVRRAFRFAYTNWLFNRLVYPLAGFAIHKREYGGISEQTYYAFNRLPSLPRLLKVLRACNLI